MATSAKYELPALPYGYDVSESLHRERENMVQREKKAFAISTLLLLQEKNDC